MFLLDFSVQLHLLYFEPVYFIFEFVNFSTLRVYNFCYLILLFDFFCILFKFVLEHILLQVKSICSVFIVRYIGTLNLSLKTLFLIFQISYLSSILLLKCLYQLILKNDLTIAQILQNLLSMRYRLMYLNYFVLKLF